MANVCESQVTITTMDMDEWKHFWYKLDRNSLEEADVVFKPETFVPLAKNTVEEERLKWGASTDPEDSWIDASEGYMYMEIFSKWGCPTELFRRISEQYPSFTIEVSAYAHDNYGINALFEKGIGHITLAHGTLLRDLRDRFGYGDDEEDDGVF